VPGEATPSFDLVDMTRDYHQNTKITLDIDNCVADNKTTCELTLPAVGFQYECEAGEQAFSGVGTDESNPTDPSSYDAKLFSVSFDWPQPSNTTYVFAELFSQV
jgi:hypothetical protein